MAVDLRDTAREVLAGALEGAGRSFSADQGDKPSGGKSGGGTGGKSGVGKGVGKLAAGAGAAALLPLAAKGLGKLAGVDLGGLLSSPGQALSGAASNLGEGAGSGLGDKLGDKLDEAGGPSGILTDTVKGLLPFGGGGGSGNGGVPGVGKGRRMPVQQSVDIGVGIETVYNQFTQFEDWPEYMHRVTRVTQDDDCTLSFAVKIWAKTKEFTVELETQRPDERIKWKVSQGITHSGVVTFHELGPNLTRVLVGLDLQPGGPLEKAARGMRYLKRAVRADLHRFKAFIEMSEQETGAWRGVIEHGELVEEHDPAYDEERSYADIEDLVAEEDEPEDDDDDEAEDQEEEEYDEDAEPEDEDQEEDEAAQPRSTRGRSRGGASTTRRSTGGRTRTERRPNGHRSSRTGGSRRSSQS